MKLIEIALFTVVATVIATSTNAQGLGFASSSSVGDSYRTLFERTSCLSDEVAADSGWELSSEGSGRSSEHGDFLSKRYILTEDVDYRLSQHYYMVGESVIHCEESVSVRSGARIQQSWSSN